MPVIDFHCDTILKLMKDEKSLGLSSNNFCVDIEKMKKGNVMTQAFALFVLMKKDLDPFEECMKMLLKFKKEMMDNQEAIAQALNYEDIVNNNKNKKISAILTIEEGGVLKGKTDNLLHFYREGVRLITLTWNFPNEIGFPNYHYQYTNKGLTSFGKEVVTMMNDLGMLVDVSHLSDRGFFDVAVLSKGPFVASHSNAREVTNHERNLTDEMIKILAGKGGIMGINFCSAFLGKSDVGTIEDMIEHIKHIYNIGGIDVIALGSDFDGIGNEVEIRNISEMDKLAVALAKQKFSDDQIDKIFYKNALRVIKEAL